MKKIVAFLLPLLWVSATHAQSSPGWTQGYVPTPAQWNAAFAAKQDYLGAPPLVTSGGIMTGKLTTAPSSTVGSGLNIAPGVAPTSPNNGDLWTTGSGLFVQIGGTTIGPLASAGGGSFAATAPLNVSSTGVVTYSCATCAVTTSPLSQFATTSSAQLLGIMNDATGTGSLVFASSPTMSGVTVTGSFTATGLVTNSDLANASTNVNGIVCTLGSSCTITASAGAITVGTTTIQSGTPGDVLMVGSGTPNTLSQYAITGTGNVVMSASPTLTGTITAAAANLSGALSSASLKIGTTLENFPTSGNIVGTTDTQTLTNKSINAANNSVTNIANTSLVNSSTTVNGQTCTLGSTCTVTAVANNLIVGTTTVTGGPGVLYNGSSGGTLTAVTPANSSVFVTNGSGVPAWSTTLPAVTLTTPNIGSATGTSLALGGATIGSNSFAVTGSSALTGDVTISSSDSDALAVGPSGTTNPALQVDSSTSASATGVNIKSAAAGGGVSLSAISSGTNEALNINAKGSGSVNIANVSPANTDIGTGGGGLIVHNFFTATGLVTFADLASASLATQSQYFSGASNVVVPASQIYQAEQTATQVGGTLTLDFNTFLNVSVTLSANITTMNLNNVKAGQSGVIRFIQPASGGPFTIALSSIFKFANGTTPTFSSSASASDDLYYTCISATRCDASLGTNVH